MSDIDKRSPGAKWGMNVVNDRFWRFDAGSDDVAAIIEGDLLPLPSDRKTLPSPDDGIVIASWDESNHLGRVHALGIVQHIDKSRCIATVDWRRKTFTVNPSPQGRDKWVNRRFFKFDDGPAVKYGLKKLFSIAFSEAAHIPGGSEAPSTGSTSIQVLARILDAEQPAIPARSMSVSPKRNRVSPDGAFIATPARGTFMGNRDYGTRWLICELKFERKLEKPREYFKLFFLDEAVALAAGHRPCATCRKPCFQAYLDAVGRSTALSRAPELDAALSAARTAPPVIAPLRSLPDGAFVALGIDDYYLIWEGSLHRWTPEGYVDPVDLSHVRSKEVVVLTPAPSVEALRHGYQVNIHPTVR